MPATTASPRNARPTVAQAYSVIKQLTASQRTKLMQKLQQDSWDKVEAAAERVAARMKADGVVITEEEIDAEVQAVRAERYAARQR